MAKHILSALFLTLCVSVAAYGQAGHFFHAWGGINYASIANTDDYYAGQNADVYVRKVDTYRPAFGVDYIYNFAPTYGFQTGLMYSMQGQKYNGRIIRDANTNQDVDIEFNSHVYLNYLRLPLMFRFNSEIVDERRVNLSIFLGLQFGYLLSADWATSPPPPDSMLQLSDVQVIDLFKKFDPGLGFGAQVNIRTVRQFYTTFGVRFNRSFSNIEKLSYPIESEDPVEFIFPVSVKKGSRESTVSRRPSKNDAVSFYVGIGYLIPFGE